LEYRVLALFWIRWVRFLDSGRCATLIFSSTYAAFFAQIVSDVPANPPSAIHIRSTVPRTYDKHESDYPDVCRNFFNARAALLPEMRR
jgi:hypothetical protein